MRDDRTVSPAFSTYAVGGRRPSARVAISTRLVGRPGTRPAIAVVVTASAMAIAFAFGIERSDVSSTAPDSTAATSDHRRAVGTAIGSVPGFSLSSPVSSRSVDDLEPSSPGSGQSIGEDGLPWIAAVQSPTADAPVNRRAAPRARTSAPPAEAISSSESSSVTSSTSPCERSYPGAAPGQVDGEWELSAAGQENTGSGSAAHPSSDVVTLQRHSPAIEKTLSSSPAGLVDDALPKSGLLADAQPVILLAPVGELVADMPAIERPFAVHAREFGGHVDAATLQPKDVAVGARLTAQPIGQEAVALADRPPAAAKPVWQASSVGPPSGTNGIVGRSEQVQRSEPTRAIAQHLERVGARYAEAPASENKAATDLPIGETSEQLTGGHAENPVPIVLADKLGAAPVVIQDDELVSIKLADLVFLFEDRLDRPLYVWMKESKSASKYVTVETLAAAGIGAKYDPRSRQVVFSVTDE